MANINFEASSNLFENKSNVVLRTNPDLTSNVKLVVDSDGSLYLDSISANRVLSDQRYKKFSIDSDSNYAYDLAKFYKNTPLGKAFETYRTVSDLSVYREYERQYEEQYHYGARLNDSKLYKDNIRFMAPLWLDKDLPEYFVVYRIDEPISEVELTDDLEGINARIMQMLKKATLIKTFDMRKGSKLGNYINNYVNDPKFPHAPVTVSFESAEKSTWNGIDLVKGGFTQSAEFMYNEFVKKDRQEILNNQFITEGFRRNKMVCANLINFEFIFDDETVDPYDVNRYIGFYVKSHTEGKFKTSSYKKGALHINTSTVETTFDLSSSSLTPISMLPTMDLNKPVLQWVKNKGTFYNVLNENTPLFQLKVPSIPVDQIGGMVKRKETLEIKSVLPNIKDFLKLNIVAAPDNGEKFALAAKSEWILVSDENEFTIFADSGVPAGKAIGLRFSNQGSLNQIALAMLSAFNNIQDSQFKITRKDNSIVIENYSTGNRLFRSFYAEHSTNSTNAVEVEVGFYDNAEQNIGLTTEYSDWNVYAPVGGSSINTAYLVDASEIGDINNNTYVKDGVNYIKVTEVVKDPFNDGYRVCLSGKTSSNLYFEASVNLYEDSYIEFGKFEAFDFIDFDYNFFSTKNSQPKELRHESEQSTDVEVNQLEDVLKYNEDWSTYFKQLEGVLKPITPTVNPNNNITNEYDRLQENYTKETSTVSRVVPTINKWVYKNGLTSRENPYFLSVSEAFGKTNFSPDLGISGRDPMSLTHEWYYIYGYPSYSSVPQTASGMGNIIRDFYSYLQPEKSINLTSGNLIDISNDWFDKIFTYEGIEINGEMVPTIINRKYTRFIKGSVHQPAETMFRGLKVKMYGRKEFVENNPRNLINTPEFNDYKFSSVLVYNNKQTQLDLGLTPQDSLSIKAIQNKKWKTVTIYIEINTTEEDVNYVNRKLLYNMRDFYTSAGSPTSVPLEGYLDFSSAIGFGNSLDVKGIGTSFIRQTQVNDSGSYGYLHFDYGGYTWEAMVEKVFNNNSIRIYAPGGTIGDTTHTQTLSLTSLPSFIWQNTDFTYIGGGYNLAKTTFERVSARNITEIFNSNNTEDIQYLTVETDGTINTNRFIINIEDGNHITKSSTLITEADSKKPQSYKVSSGIIGYINTERSTPVNVELVRMSGDYTPNYRKVISFTDLYRNNKIDYDWMSISEEEARQKIVYNRYNRLGISFASYQEAGYDKFGLIEDMHFHKINPEKADGILKLSNSTEDQPLYPLIGEIAIDKRDINVLRSSWEDGFYTKNDNQFNRSFVFGTLSASEEGAFLASTLNLPKAAYDITNYNSIIRVNSLEEMKSYKDSNNYAGDLIIFEDDSNIWMDFYLKNNLVNILKDDNAGYSIKKYVDASQSYGDKTSIDDDIIKYIESNLIQLMGIEEIRVWNQKTKQITESTVLNASNLQEILNTSFLEEKSFRLEYDTVQPLNVRLIYNKRPGFRHELYVYVKISS